MGIKVKVGSWDNMSWVEQYNWGCTSERYIWQCVETGYYHYSDETSQFDIWGYESIEECEEALDIYVDYLQGK